jgi:hypothetical protein
MLSTPPSENQQRASQERIGFDIDELNNIHTVVAVPAASNPAGCG